MTTLVPPDVVRRATSWHRPLMIFSGLMVLVAAGAYAGLTALVTWQALRGQSLIHPALWTLTTLATILAATGLGARAALTAQPVRTDTA